MRNVGRQILHDGNRLPLASVIAKRSDAQAKPAGMRDNTLTDTHVFGDGFVAARLAMTNATYYPSMNAFSAGVGRVASR
jgi:hypothetical protein